MEPTKGLFLTGLFLATVFAGCIGGDDGGNGADALNVEGAHDANTGSVSGQVLDDTLLPLQRARVSLLTPDGEGVFRIAEPDMSGRYAFNFLPAGEYKVEALSPGYAPQIVDVEVTTGEKVEGLTFIMQPGFQDVAYYVTDAVTRMIGGGTVKYNFHCSETPLASVVPDDLKAYVGKYCVGGNFCQVQCSDVSSGCQGSYSSETGADDNGYGGSSYAGGYRDLLMGEDIWQTQLAEVTWEQSSAISGRGVLFEVLGPNVTNNGGAYFSRCGSLNQSDPRDFLVVSDTPPFRIEINDDLMQSRGISLEDRCCDWRWRLFPGWCDLGNCARWGPDANVLGLVAPTRVDIYYTIFFKEAAPPGWSTLPEA